MNDTVLELKGISKQYLIGPRQPYYSLRDSIMSFLNKPVSLTGEKKHSVSQKTFWALKDINFTLKRGETLGLIGRNGAGKSTLLKILSRITPPTEGEAIIRGKIASLLEVGTGFNPELTGRENIYLNGAILGMKQREIKKKFDEIVAFAEVDKFVDTPVKHYSSGMYVRLAFAVASQLEADILVIDEVLAVGDSAFQQKSWQRMNEITRDGRTIILVSHNMAAIESLTNRAIVLENGRVIADGEQHAAVAKYLKSLENKHPQDLSKWTDRKGSGEIIIEKLETTNLSGKKVNHYSPGEPIKISLIINYKNAITADVGFVVEGGSTAPLFASHLSDSQPLRRLRGRKRFSAIINPAYLRQGRYFLTLAVFNRGGTHFYDKITHFPAFEVVGEGNEVKFPVDGRWGDLYLPLNWSYE